MPVYPQRVKCFSRKGAKTLRLHLPVVKLKLNRKLKVQECDARMLIKEQMQGAK
jgi:hypothetical protein